MSLTQSLKTKINCYAKQVYHHFFEYDLEKLTTYGQNPAKIIRILEHALFYREFVLITYQDGKTEIGQIIDRTTSGRFVFRRYDNKLLRIIDLSDLFNIERD